MQSHGLQNTRLLCLPLSPGVYSNSCSLTSMMLSKHLILCPLFSFCLSLTQYQGFFFFFFFFPSESSLHIWWTKYCSFSFSISSSKEYSGLTSFRIDWLDLLAFLGTLKSLLQHRHSKASILWHSAPFMVHLSHLYMTTQKTEDLTIWTFAHISLISVEYSYYQDLSIIDMEY